MKAVKIVVAAVAALVVLLVAGALVIAARFDPNDYKDYLTDAFAARTGRTLTIEEDLRLDFFPWLAVETGGITIGNAPGFGEAPFATAAYAAARVKLLPLLSRKLEIGTVRLDGLVLNLERNTENRSNWEDFLEMAPREAAEPEQDSPALEQLALEGIAITNGSITWSEAGTLLYSVTGLELVTGPIGERTSPVDLRVALELRDARAGKTYGLRADGTLTAPPAAAFLVEDLDAQLTLDLADGRRTIAIELASLTLDPAAETLRTEGLRTSTAGAAARWQVAAEALFTSPSVTGAVTVDEAALAALLDAFALRPPEGVAPRSLGSVAVRAAFGYQADGRIVRLSDVEATGLGITVRGSGTLEGGERLRGRIEIPEFVASSTVHALLRAVVPPTVDVTALERLALATAFEANLRTGSAALRGLEATVFDANLRGELEAIPGDNGNVFRGSITTSRFPAAAFTRVFAQLLSETITAEELGMIQLDGRFAFDTGADTLTVAPFEAELFGLRGSGELMGRNVSRAAAWGGTLRVNEFSPQALITRFGLPPQPTSDAQALTRASLTARFEATRERAAFRDIALALDDSRITGDFTVDGLAGDLRYLFTLAVDRVDADRYLPPKARDAQPGETTAGDIELPENNTMNLDGTMTIGDLRLAGMQFQDVGARILIGGGDAKLENARARLYGGEFSGSFHVRAAGDQPGLTLDGRASGLNLKPLIEALTGEPANFRGTGSFEINLSGRGRTVIENVRSASGNVSFAMRDGAIEGFNLGRTLCAAYNLTQRAPAPPPQPDETLYEAIQGTATVSAGTAHSRDLLARTAFMDMYGQGSLVLIEQTLDYDLDAKLTAPIAIPGCQTMDGLVGQAIPFDIRGTVTDPTITPDFSKIVQRAIREEVKERVQERLQERLQDRLRDLLR